MLEKFPLFALAAASGVITYVAQRQGGAMMYGAAVPLATRVANALVAYVAYLGRMVWPTHLAVFYPYVERPLWQAGLAALFLLAVTALAIWQVRRRPYLAVGWFWYLATLVPVIGFVQVGGQAMADRYTYLPLVGLFIAVAWGLADLAATCRHAVKVLAPLGAVVLAACAVLAGIQVRYWSDSETLYRRAIAVTGDNILAQGNLAAVRFLKGDYADAAACAGEAVRLNPLYGDAQSNLGLAMMGQGRLAEALAPLREAVRLLPRSPSVHNNLGLCLYALGRPAEAVEEFRAALRETPDFPEGHNNLGLALVDLGRTQEAVAEYRESLGLRPGHAATLANLGAALFAAGQTDEGLARTHEALRIAPHLPVAHNTIGMALILQGRAEEGMAEFRRAAALDPTYPQAHFNLAEALARQGRSDAAAAEFREALRLRPDAGAHRALARVLLSQGRGAEAASHLTEALRLRPDYPEALTELAMIRAADPDRSLRSGAEAVALADRACRLTGRKAPECLDALAAGYAEAAHFDEAVAAAREAAALARSQGRADLAAEIEVRQRLYERGITYRRSS